MIKKKNFNDMIVESKANGGVNQYICEDGTLSIYNFDTQNVGEVLERGDFWCQSTSHFISAGTGVGKTTMIFNKILPEAKKRRTKILVLVNRSSLALHYKKTIIKADDDARHLDGRFTEKGLMMADNFEFGRFHVVTYQSIVRLNLDFQVYGIVIFDECQYFLSDCTFNRYTQRDLNYLMDKCKKTPKIFLTATPEECFFPIFYTENRTYRFERHMFFLYHFERKFDNISLTFFVDKNTLKVQADKNEKKWIIFVDSKHYGEDLVEFFNKDNQTKAVFLDAESKYNEKKIYVNDLIESEDFQFKILIVTKAFDVGININTSNINMAIFSLNKTDFVQMLGRKRKVGDETVNVFIYLYSLEEIKDRISKNKRRLDEINNYNYTLQSPVYGEKIEFPYYADQGRYQKNFFTQPKIENEIEYLQSITNNMEKSDDVFYNRLASLYLKWVEKNDENVIEKIIDKDSENEKNNSIRSIVLEMLEHNNISAEMFNDVGKRILEIENPRKDNRRDRDKVTTTMVNRVIKKVGYNIKKKNDFYILIKEREC